MGDKMSESRKKRQAIVRFVVGSFTLQIGKESRSMALH